MRVYEYKLQREFLKEVPTVKVNDSRTAYDYLKNNCYMSADMYRENSYLVFLNKAGEVLGHSLLSIGGTDCTTMDIKLACKLSLTSMASAVILSHNHPSNNPVPSTVDLNETHKLKKALDCFGIGLLDHIIVTDDSYYSFAEEKTYNAE